MSKSIVDREKDIKDQLRKEISLIAPFDTRLNDVNNRIVDLIAELIDTRISEEMYHTFTHYK